MTDDYLLELEKLAADAAAMLRAVTKAKNVHIAKNPGTLGRGGAQTVIARPDHPYAGRIDVDPQGADAVLGMMSGVGGTKTDAGRRALTSVLASHELAERAVKRRDFAPFASHLSPEVLLKEHNALSRLTGEGAGEARKVLRNVRRRTGESEHMRNLVVQQYGPRAAQFFNEGEKIPKAMRKDLRRRLRQDPSILQKAAPGTLSSLRRAGRDIVEAPTRIRGLVESVRKLSDYIKDVP